MDWVPGRSAAICLWWTASSKSPFPAAPTVAVLPRRSFPFVLVVALAFAGPAAAQNETEDAADGNETGPPADEKQRLPAPVVIAGSLVSLLILVGILLLARRPRKPL